MHIPRALTAAGSATLLALATVAPAAAADEVGIARGNLTWDGQYQVGSGEALRPGRTSVFRVRDGAPRTDSRKGDRGWYRFSERNETYDQELTLRVRCVRVQGNWAEFAGVTTDATGNFRVGEAWLVSVRDLDPPHKHLLHIGMQAWGDLDAACAAALDDEQYQRKGRYTGGRLRTLIR